MKSTSGISNEMRRKASEYSDLKHNQQLNLLSRKISLRCLDYCIDFPKDKYTVSEVQCVNECAAQFIEETELVGSNVNNKIQEMIKEMKEKVAQLPKEDPPK